MNLMPGTVEEDAGAIAIRVEGSAIAVRTAIAVNRRGPVGRKVLCGIRPEAIVRSAANSAGPNVFETEIEIVEPTGSDNLAYFRLGANEVLARLAPGSCNPGDRITLSLPPEKVLVYDAESQQLLA